MENINKNETDMRRIRVESAKQYESNVGAILNTDETSPDFMVRINTVTEIKSTCCPTETMAIVYGIIKKGDVFDAFPENMLAIIY